MITVYFQAFSEDPEAISFHEDDKLNDAIKSAKEVIAGIGKKLKREFGSRDIPYEKLESFYVAIWRDTDNEMIWSLHSDGRWKRLGRFGLKSLGLERLRERRHIYKPSNADIPF
jgi:hypothetical protein